MRLVSRLLNSCALKCLLMRSFPGSRVAPYQNAMSRSCDREAHEFHRTCVQGVCVVSKFVLELLERVEQFCVQPPCCIFQVVSMAELNLDVEFEEASDVSEGREDASEAPRRHGKERGRKKSSQKEKNARSAKKRRKPSKSPSEESAPSEAQSHGSESKASGEKRGKQGKPNKKNKGPPRKKGGRRAGKGGAGAASAASTKQGGSKWQKCSACKKTLDKSKDFHADQTKCKTCNADIRAFHRATEAQGCAEKVQELSKSDPATHTRVLKEWVKERKKMQAAGDKVKFNIWQFVISLRHSEGERIEARGRMMWRSYFLSWCQTDEGGNLSEQEGKKQWQEHEANKKLARDFNGPGGHLRLKIPMFDDVVEFKQLSRDRELSKSEKLNPKAMLENKGGAARLRMKMLVGGGGSSTDNMGDAQSWNAIRDKMNSSQMDGELALQPQAEDLIVDLQQKNRRRASGASRPDDSDGSAASSSGPSEYSDQEESKEMVGC